ncbi:hypothetical protein NGM37_55155 [Streptomyces sp. TRM76130]|nr:hypothetical protein [Streptomyces sp. TRM76130]
MTRYQVKGFEHGEAVCDKCGSQLREAIVLAPMDLNGAAEKHPYYVGVDCAAQLTRLSQSTVRSKALRAQEVRQRETETLRRREAYRKLLEQRELDWLRDTYGVEDMDAASKKSGKD